MGGYREMDTACRIALKSLARRYLELHDEIGDLDRMIKSIVDDPAPDLVARDSIGYGSAGQLLITAGDNPERLKSEASFAALCGVSPIPASSGKTDRHRLNRGGDRAANSALHIVAICRLRCDEPRTVSSARRTADGLSESELTALHQNRASPRFFRLGACSRIAAGRFCPAMLAVAARSRHRDYASRS